MGLLGANGILQLLLGALSSPPPPPHPTPRKPAESTLCNQAATWDVCVWAGEQAQVNEASWQLVGSREGGTDPDTLKRKPHPVDIQSQMENLSLALLMSPL